LVLTGFSDNARKVVFGNFLNQDGPGAGKLPKSPFCGRCRRD
jgi:hypothetical protein